MEREQIIDESARRLPENLDPTPYSQTSEHMEVHAQEQEVLEQQPQQQEQEIATRSSVGQVQLRSDLQVISQHVEVELQKQAQIYNRVWKPVVEGKTHRKLEEVYHTISPEGIVYFDVLDQGKFILQTEENFQELIQNHKVDTVKRWNDDEIEKMFGKGLNPTSLITSLESAQWFARESNLSVNPTVLELGTGAGWATVMLYETLRKQYPESHLKQFSVDMSPHAIAATETLLNYRGIPYVVAANREELEQIQSWIDSTQEGKEFSGIILVLDNINEILHHFPDKSVDGVYSSHGTAYLSKNEYTDFLKSLPLKIKKDGIFIADSLNPLYTNKLDIKTTISQMISPKRMKESLTRKGIKYMYGGKIRNNSKYFPGDDVQILKGFNTPQAYLIFEWCNYLLKNLDFSRLLKTVKSLRVTMKVVDEYRSDVFPSFLLKDIASEEKLNFESLNGAPEFPIFMDTQGFRIKE